MGCLVKLCQRAAALLDGCLQPGLHMRFVVYAADSLIDAFQEADDGVILPGVVIEDLV